MLSGERLEQALLVDRVDRVAGRAGDHRDLAAVGQRLAELLTPGVAEGADVAAAVGEVVGARLADLARRPGDDLRALLGRGAVGGHQRFAGVGEADDHVVALGGEAADVGDRLLGVEVGVGVADLADLGVGQRLQDELHLEDLAGDVAAEPVGEADLQLATGAGVAAVVLPALERQVLVDRRSTPAAIVARAMLRARSSSGSEPAPPRAAGRGCRVGDVVLAELAVGERAAELVGAGRPVPTAGRCVPAVGAGRRSVLAEATVVAVAAATNADGASPSEGPAPAVSMLRSSGPPVELWCRGRVDVVVRRRVVVQGLPRGGPAVRVAVPRRPR